MKIPDSLLRALKPVTVVCGHYGAGKTNLCMNLAIDLSRVGRRVSVIDLDVVNPYFRASEQRALLDEHGIRLIAPVFSEAGTSLDVPSLTGAIAPAIETAGANDAVIVDAGGDDVGATALGRYARIIAQRDYAMLYVANSSRNLVADPREALENMREIEQACHLKATAIASNAHLKGETDEACVQAGHAHAVELAELSGLPLVATTVPEGVSVTDVDNVYPVSVYVKTPWE